jgi:hypothetical protein
MFFVFVQQRYEVFLKKKTLEKKYFTYLCLNIYLMAHPILHAKSSAKKFGGKWEDYIHIHNWFDETKAWYGHSNHRIFRHHSEGIFECEKIFGASFINSDNKIVYTRYVGEQHVREDCYNQIPTAKEWIETFFAEKKPMWMLRTLDIEIND